MSPDLCLLHIDGDSVAPTLQGCGENQRRSCLMNSYELRGSEQTTISPPCLTLIPTKLCPKGRVRWQLKSHVGVLGVFCFLHTSQWGRGWGGVVPEEEDTLFTLFLEATPVWPLHSTSTPCGKGVEGMRTAEAFHLDARVEGGVKPRLELEFCAPRGFCHCLWNQ